MSCSICKKSACAYWMHSLEAQERYKSVIEGEVAVNILRQKIKEQRNELENTDAEDQ